jgi:hypothetical protein
VDFGIFQAAFRPLQCRHSLWQSLRRLHSADCAVNLPVRMLL